MAERARIAQFFAPLAQGEPGSFSLTDDAAVLTPAPGQRLAVTTDSVIEGVHLLPDATPSQFAIKLMRRNLSDLAAMGAAPWRYTLNLHTPRGLKDEWFAEFSEALAAEQEAFDLILVGGDTTSGPAKSPIHITLTCFGLMPPAPLRRNGARPGEDVYVSGTIGNAALGLKLLQRGAQHPTYMDFLTAAYHAPQPRLMLGQALLGVASAALDISDGLLSDASQLAQASGVGLRIEQYAIPRSAALQYFLDRHPEFWQCVLSGGDDYELLFTAPASMREHVETIGSRLGIHLVRIGVVTQETGLVLVDKTGTPQPILTVGYEHG